MSVESSQKGGGVEVRCLAVMLLLAGWVGVAPVVGRDYKGLAEVDADGALPIDFDLPASESRVTSIAPGIAGAPDRIEFSTTPAPVSSIGAPVVLHFMGAKALSSKPDFGASLSLALTFSSPVSNCAFDVVEANFLTPREMAKEAGASGEGLSLGKIIERLDQEERPCGVVVRAFDDQGTPVSVTFDLVGMGPTLAGLAAQSLSARGGPVTAVSIPGNGAGVRGTSVSKEVTSVMVTLIAVEKPFSRITIEPPKPGFLGVPANGDFIAIDNLDFPDAAPTAGERDIEDWIVKLGANQPDVRKEAQQRLVALGVRARRVLMKHRDHADIEIRESVRELLKP